jgi:hypothetical protein
VKVTVISWSWRAPIYRRNHHQRVRIALCGEPGVLTLARPGPVMARRAAATGDRAGDAAAINRARGHPSED